MRFQNLFKYSVLAGSHPFFGQHADPGLLLWAVILMTISFSRAHVVLFWLISCHCYLEATLKPGIPYCGSVLKPFAIFQTFSQGCVQDFLCRFKECFSPGFLGAFPPLCLLVVLGCMLHQRIVSDIQKIKEKSETLQWCCSSNYQILSSFSSFHFSEFSYYCVIFRMFGYA